MQLQQRITVQPLLMKVPSLLQFGLRVHHARSIPGDGFPKPDSSLRRPGPLPDRYCRRETSERIVGALADQDLAAIDLLFGQDTEGPPQFAFGSRAEVIGTCGVRQFFLNKQTCCAA